MAAAPYRTVDLASVEFEPVAKLNKLYVANLATPLTVLTPPVQLTTPIESDAAFAYIRPTGEFAQFLRDTEAHLLAQSIENKAAWFRKEVDDDALRHNFKSFFRDDEFKVKVDEQLAVFDAHKQPVGAEDLEAGVFARCVLELTRVCFGRQEFGAMWRLVQARVTSVPPCLIEDEAAEETEEEEDGDQPRDTDEQEFL